MRDFWHCPVCRGNYDHGEPCDCQKRKPVTYCFMCHMPLFPEDALHEQDSAHEIDGHVFCEDCVDKYVRKNCFKVLPFVTVPNDYGTHEELYGREIYER